MDCYNCCPSSQRFKLHSPEQVITIVCAYFIFIYLFILYHIHYFTANRNNKKKKVKKKKVKAAVDFTCCFSSTFVAWFLNLESQGVSYDRFQDSIKDDLNFRVNSPAEFKIQDPLKRNKLILYYSGVVFFTWKMRIIIINGFEVYTKSRMQRRKVLNYKFIRIYSVSKKKLDKNAKN